jgi:16S rRNA (uracil1498-N3)-methyltransferase
MTQRYFVEQPIAGPQATLLAAEAHHLAHVMRAKPGMQVTLFDGRGGEYLAEVTRVERAAIQLSVLSHQPIERELSAPVIVGASLPKGDRQRWLVEKLVELGVQTFVPLATAHAVAQPTDNARERLERAVIEASKQCGRNRLMRIEVPQAWRAFVTAASVEACRLIAHPGVAQTLGDLLRAGTPPPIAGFAVAVGPEGGLTDEEVAIACEAGWAPVSLGPCILRVETAATLMASAAALMSVATSRATP